MSFVRRNVSPDRIRIARELLADVDPRLLPIIIADGMLNCHHDDSLELFREDLERAIAAATDVHVAMSMAMADALAA